MFDVSAHHLGVKTAIEGLELAHTEHEWPLVVLAYLVACAAAYATLAFSERAAFAESSKGRLNWCIVSSLALGGGIWSMHFIAMLAFRTPVEMLYSPGLSLLSLVIAIMAAASAMPALATFRPNVLQQLSGTFGLGLGVALMHYVGMLAIRTQAQLHYSLGYVVLSLIIALAASYAAIAISLFFRRQQGNSRHWLRLLASAVMALAVASMHFVGMHALQLWLPIGHEAPMQSPQHAFSLGVSIAALAFGAIVAGLSAAHFERKIESKDRDLERVNNLLKQLKMAKSSLQQVANYDPLTELLNRRSFYEQSNQRIKSASGQETLALMFLDIDHFKRINDSLGHEAGDALLKTLADRIRATLRDRDMASRFGGDEFCLLAHLSRPEEAKMLAQRILQIVKLPVRLDTRQVVMSTSIGIALYPQDGQSTEELLKHADLALYQSKAQGRNCARFFNQELRLQACQKLELEDELRSSLANNQGLVLYYQPILNLSTHHVDKFEALLRWQHPRLGLLAPDRFIGIAEANGFIAELDAWVLNKACADITGVVKQFPSLKVAVNCSALNLSHHGLFDVIQQALKTHQLAPQVLELELTENALMHSVDIALALLERLRELGVSISIDDFGTGYSSLAYLSRLPIDTLKIDRSFITNLPEKTSDEQIVRAIIAMAHSLGLKVVGEGVERPDQLGLLRKVGCDFIQGYYLSKPMPINQLPNFLQAHGQTRLRNQ